MKNKIIVTTDLTKVADQAIKQATLIARKAKTSLTLFHVITDKSPTKEEVEKILTSEAERIRQEEGVECGFLIREGNIFDTIPLVAREHEYDLIVIGTHGIHGIRQSIFGADIVKLVARIPITVLVIQEDSPLIERFSKIVLPVSSHHTFSKAIDSVLKFSNLYNTEVHLYSIQKPGFDWPEQLMTNIINATVQFETKGVKMVRVREDPSIYSQGYARQTLKYAHAAGADLICIMSVPSEEYHYFAQADKESMLLNEYHLPVLCS